MRRKLTEIAIATLLASAPLQTNAFAEDSLAKAREIFSKNSHGVVTVEVVQKTNAGGKSRESKTAVTGTVLDSSGLTVVSLSTIDPAPLWRKVSEDYKLEVEISDTKIMLDDGTELSAEIVLRDKDMDLAFIRPKAKVASPMSAIDFKDSGTADILDTVVVLNRLKQAVGRAYSASLEHIAAMVKRPRTFYVPDNSPSESGMGSPVFAMDGKVVGLLVMRAVNSAGSSNYRDCVSVIILPAEEIMKAAAQAPEAKGDAPDKDAPKDTAAPSTNSPSAK